MGKTGYRPSMSEASKAMCAGCTGQYGDGRIDCQHQDCPIYNRMPYKRNRPIFNWLFGKWTKRHIVKAGKFKITDPNKYAQTKLKRDGKIRIPMSDMFKAKCFRCMGDFRDSSGSLENNEGEDKETGRLDCQIMDCPLYYWMPYRKLEPTYNWMFDYCHTKKHRIRLVAEGLTREQYVRIVLGKEDE